MYKTMNGWTKAKMIQAIMKGNKGICSADTDNCLYRSEFNGETNKCAVGCFIPDSAYRNDMEGKSIKGLVESNPKLYELLPLASVYLTELQNLHDEYLENTSDPRPALVEWIEKNVTD